MKQTWLMLYVAMSCSVAVAQAQVGDGFVGVYADTGGTQACTTVPPFTGRTLHVIAKTGGASTDGITGVELRIEVSNPDGWDFSYIPPSGSIALGTMLDTDPSSQNDGSGLNLAFPTCRVPNAYGNIRLGTIRVFNDGGSPTSLFVKRHSSPSNGSFQCPLFAICDSPNYTTVCMSPSTDEPCSLTVEKGIIAAYGGDAPVFAAVLNTPMEVPNEEPPDPGSVLSQVVCVPTLVSDGEEPDRVGEIHGSPPRAAKVLSDTVWIADWTFDVGGASGWTKYDNRLLNNGEIYWSTSSLYAGEGGIVSKAAVLRSFEPCWADTGYGNNWDQSLRLNYKGTSASLAFDVLLETEQNDGLSIEVDPGCVSQQDTIISRLPEDLRIRVPDNETYGGSFISMHFQVTLPATASPSCIYVRFTSDNSGSDEDGLFMPGLRAGLVVDNIVVTGDIAYTEDFESQTWNANVIPVNSAPSLAVGEWARVYYHATDNDKCTENGTYAWLFSDPLKMAYFPDMGFGPGGAIIRNWLDDILVSPWVAVPNDGRSGTILSFREFPGNDFRKSEIMRSWSVRTTPAGSSCRTVWSNDGDKGGLTGTWQDLSTFRWVDRVHDMSLFVPHEADSLQVRFRVSDWQYIYRNAPPVTLNTGPGPYIDRVRIGRLVLTGPVISEGEDSRSQAQDAFPDRWVTPHGVYPRHGTCSFSASVDLAPQRSHYVIPPDSIWVSVVDRRGGGDVFVMFYGAIVSGPHAGKAPPPYTVGANGFFEVTADSCRVYGVSRPGQFFVDLGDEYFRGGDRLLYYWYAEDEAGGKTTDPPGITNPPNSVAAAERLTGGLLEVSYLPTIAWDPGYLARITADDHGDIEPTLSELENSPQRNCILYVNKVDLRRRSASRTSFMYTLDGLGFGTDSTGVRSYDIYDIQGFGNTHNDLISRCDAQYQASGYALIVHDAGRMRTGAIPDGTDSLIAKLHQDEWYASWLTTCGGFNEYGFANLWLIGENIATNTKLSPLLGPTMGLTFAQDAAPASSSPTVQSQVGFQFIQPLGFTDYVSFPTFRLNGGCPVIRDYDTCTAWDATATHVYEGVYWKPAVVMRHATTIGLGYESRYNTIWMGFPWMDIAAAPGNTMTPARDLAGAILNATVVINCGILPHPATDLGDDATTSIPRSPALHQNHPNPFNPMTAIEFDTSEDAGVSLRVYDLSGRLVRTLVGERMPAGRHAVSWNGTDDSGHSVSSGLYVYQLQAGSFIGSRKMVVLR